MFFGPTLLALTISELGNHLKILCLSNGARVLLQLLPRVGANLLTGDADGLGEVRKKELVKRGLHLGLR
jgi:N-acetylglucosaminylphosphatidylinositol deacetylase